MESDHFAKHARMLVLVLFRAYGLGLSPRPVMVAIRNNGDHVWVP